MLITWQLAAKRLAARCYVLGGTAHRAKVMPSPLSTGHLAPVWVRPRFAVSRSRGSAQISSTGFGLGQLKFSVRKMSRGRVFQFPQRKINTRNDLMTAGCLKQNGRPL